MSRESYSTGLVIILESRDKDLLCETMSQIMKIAKRRNIKAKLQGILMDDDCLEMDNYGNIRMKRD